MDLNQVSVPTLDLSVGISFYRKLGLRLIVHDPVSRYARFELPSGASTLSLHEDKLAKPGSIVLYLEVDDLDRHHTDLCAAGFVFESPPTLQEWRWREAYLLDPAGNRLCLFHAGVERRFPPWRLADSV